MLSALFAALSSDTTMSFVSYFADIWGWGA